MFSSRYKLTIRPNMINNWTPSNTSHLFERCSNANVNAINSTLCSISNSINTDAVQLNSLKDIHQNIRTSNEVSILIDSRTWHRFVYRYSQLYFQNHQHIQNNNDNRSKQSVQFSIRKRPSTVLRPSRFSSDSQDQSNCHNDCVSNKIRSVLGQFEQWPVELKDYCKEVYRECGKSQALINKAHKYLLQIIEETLRTCSSLDSVNWLSLPMPEFLTAARTLKDGLFDKLAKREVRPFPSLGSIVKLPSPKKDVVDTLHNLFLFRLPRMGKQRKYRVPNVDRLTVGVQNQLNLNMKESTDIKAEMTDIIMGTSTELEKNFLRLTTTPDASTIRPLPILQQAFVFVCEKAKLKDIRYLCDQLRSIRQDLTVQNIKNDFTVKVYETNVMTALNACDREEFNQCQSRLMDLYKQGFVSANRCKFTGFRMLYCILTKDFQSLMQIYLEILLNGFENELKDVLLLYQAWSSRNTFLLFRSYKKLSTDLQLVANMFIDRERSSTIAQFLKAFRPTLSQRWISSQLCYPNNDSFQKHMQSLKIVFSESDSALVDCKSSNC
ncbi:hypothetical protein GJ496_005121 [Pomphorhynchus laevis]|nr:hypothetical protein GJ496_005121 [Pomphorhynchus laevis]